MIDQDVIARRQMISAYVHQIMDMLDEDADETARSELDNLARLLQVMGDVAFVVRWADRDLLDVLAVVSAEAQRWMETLMAERAR